MADIIDLSPAPPAPMPSVRKIRIASRALEWLFTAVLVFSVAVGLLGLWALFFYQGENFAIGPRGGLITTGPLPPDFVPFHTWRLAQRLAYVPVVVVRTAPLAGLFWSLRQLFRLYAEGQVFTPRNAALIKWIGVFLIAHAAAPFACHLALSATGYEIDRMWAHMVSLDEVMLGAVVFVIAQVMQAGREIEEDREGFV
jgi:hypothetical protein